MCNKWEENSSNYCFENKSQMRVNHPIKPAPINKNQWREKNATRE